jgi:two-component system, OmpR family, response regulator
LKWQKKEKSVSQELKKVLYVEDEVDIQKVVKMALEMIGKFEVLVCGSGPEALEKAPAFAPDLCLLDVMMPGMDGPATLVALREIEQFKKVPFAFLTAKVQSEEIARFKELGAIDVIIKPFDPMALPDQVRAIWDQR